MGVVFILSGIFVLIGSLVLGAISPWMAVTRNAMLSPANLILIPSTVIALACNQAMQIRLNRRRQYQRVAIFRAIQAAVMCAVQILLGLTGATVSEYALTIGYFLGQLTAFGLAFRVLNRDIRSAITGRSFARLQAIALEYARFPKYLIPGHLANLLSSQVPVIFLALLYSAESAGYYALAERALVAPVALIGGAVGEVYRQRAAKMISDSGNCRGLFLNLATRLAVGAALLYLVVRIYGPELFDVVFGQRWGQSGEFARAMAGMVFFQAIAYPLSQTVLLSGRHGHDLFWQMLRLAGAIISFGVGFALGLNALDSVGLFAATFSVLYVLHIGLQYRSASGISA